MCFLQMMPELALVVGQGLKKRTGSAVQGVRLILDAAGRRNCRDSKKGSEFSRHASASKGKSTATRVLRS